MTNIYKIIMIMIMILGSMMTISSYSWTGMWIGLEINLLAIIPLMSNSNNKLSSESALKYFIIQALASAMLLFAMIIMMINYSSMNNLIYEDMFMIILNSSLLTKMGAAPFHFWFPEVMEGLNWMNCLLLLTWQKLAPMAIMMYNMKPFLFMSMIILVSMMISGIMGINQTSIRKILAFSSINHIAWMLSSMMFNETIWLIYFMTYTIISINIILLLNSINIFFTKQLFVEINNSLLIKMLFLFNFLSLGGLPPFLGFYPKWLTIQMLMFNKWFLMALFMVILTLITLYFYTRITFSTLMMMINEPSWNKPKKISISMISFNFIMLISLIFTPMISNWM